MKNFLRATAASQGLDPEKGAARLIQDMMTSTMSTTTSTQVAFDKEQTDRLSGDDAAGKPEKETIDLDQSALIVSGRGTPRNYALNQGTTRTITIDGEYYQTPDDKSGEPLNRSMTLQNLFQNTKIAGTVNVGSVYMGDQRLSEAEFDRVVYANNGFLTTTLPYKTDAEGNKVVDLNTLEAIAQVKDEIKQHGYSAPIDKRRVYKEHGIDQYYDSMETEDAPINEAILAPFLVFNGLTSDESDFGIKGFKTSKYLQIDDTKRSIYERAIDTDMFEGKGKVDTSSTLGFGGGDIISGTIYIPITDDQISVYCRNKSTKIPKSHGQVDRLRRNQELNNKKQSLTNTSANSLD
jgi:hypothetical protein